VFNPAVERVGLDPGLTFRGLRKVATSYMVDDGVHPRVIQHRLGHATARPSQELYAHVSDAADQDAASRLGTRFVDATCTQRPAVVEVTGLEPATSTLRT